MTVSYNLIVKILSDKKRPRLDKTSICLHIAFEYWAPIVSNYQRLQYSKAMGRQIPVYSNQGLEMVLFFLFKNCTKTETASTGKRKTGLLSLPLFAAINSSNEYCISAGREKPESAMSLKLNPLMNNSLM